MSSKTVLTNFMLPAAILYLMKFIEVVSRDRTCMETTGKHTTLESRT